MKIDENFTIAKDFSNTRLDRWLKIKIQKFPQSFIEKLLRSGKVRINKQKIKSSYKLKINDIINVCFEYQEAKINNKFSYDASSLEHKNIMKNIIFENQDYMILNKDSGISVQSGSKSPKNIIDILNKFADNKKYYLVHRIDKETSGILILACNREFARNLSEQFKNKSVKKKYLVILYGSVINNSGVLEHNLKFKEKGKIKSFKAETNFFVISKNKNYTFVEASPITGRKHQLRQQFFNINNPIVGDNKYFSPHYKKNSKKLMLHSHQITFNYKNKKKIYKIEPSIEFKNFLKSSNL